MLSSIITISRNAQIFGSGDLTSSTCRKHFITGLNSLPQTHVTSCLILQLAVGGKRLEGSICCEDARVLILQVSMNGFLDKASYPSILSVTHCCGRLIVCGVQSLAAEAGHTKSPMHGKDPCS